MTMEVNIKNHNDGLIAAVTPDYQLKTQAESLELQHFISREKGQTFQVIGRTDTLTAATIPILHVTNNDPDRLMVISYIRAGVVDSNATLPGVGDYIQLGVGTTGSGGTAVTPVNTNRSSGKTASITALHSTPTSSGTFSEIDTFYPKADGEQQVWNKAGSVILGLGDTFEARIVSTATTGIAWARFTFMMLDK